MTNKFVSFLKKVGQVVAAGVGIAADVLPILSPLATALLPAKYQSTATTVESAVTSDISIISGVVGSVESVSATLASPLTGPQKAVAVGAQLGPIFLASEAFAGKKIANPTAFNAAMVTIAGGFADAWNAVDGAALPNLPIAAPPQTPPQS